MNLYYIKTPLEQQKPILAESLYHAIQKCVEQDGFLYSNSEYKEVKNKKIISSDVIVECRK